MKKRKSGSGAEEVYTSTWPYFNALKFITASLLPRQSTSNLTLSAEVCENAADHAGNDAVATAAMPAASSTKRSRKSARVQEDEYLSQALNFMRRVPDEYDTFGEYVAMELRSLSSDTYRKMLKRDIRQSIVRITELDDLNSLSTPTDSPVAEAPPPGP